MCTNVARRVGSAVLLMLACFALACASDEEKVAEHLERAAQYREERAYSEEVLELMSALQIDPQSAEVNQMIARAYEALGKPAEATFYFGEAYRLDPSLTSAGLAQVPVLMASDPEAADALIDEVLEREPDNARAYVRRAEVALVRVDTEAALQAALTAVELAPEDVLTHRALGTVYRAIIREKGLRRQEREDSLFEAALAAFERAEALPSQDVVRGRWQDRKNKALVYSDWPGHQEQAVQALREALELAREGGELRPQLEVVNEVIRQAGVFGVGGKDFLRWGLERRLELVPADVQAWSRLAALSMAEGESSDAVWQRALAARPDDLRIHLAYARALAGSDRYAEAIAHLEALPAALADNPRVPASLVELNLAAGRIDAARAALARLRELDAEPTLAELAGARIALSEGRIAAAVESLRALSRDSERPEVFQLLALGELRSGDGRAALAAAERAFELDKTPGPELVRIRMEAQAKLHDWQAVLRSADELRLKRFPARPRELLLEAEAAWATGKDARARRLVDPMLAEGSLEAILLYARYETAHRRARVRKLLEGALESYPTNGALLRALMLVDIADGNPERALERVAQWERGEAFPSELRLLRAKLLAAVGRVEEAEQEALAIFHSHPGWPEGTALLVRIYEAQGKRDQAIVELEKVRDQGALRPTQLWLLGRLYLDSGNLARARELLEAALRQAPELDAARNDLAFVLAELNQELPRAVDLAREAKAARPEDPAVSDTLGYVYYRRGLLEPALAELQSAIEGAKAQGEVPADFHYHLGLVLQALGRSEEAIREFDAALAIQPEHAAAKDARAELSSAAAERAGG